MSLPTITVVTPSFNQGAFLERTLRSVLGQRYPFLEYLVMDGGSTDGSVDVLRRYAPWLTHWQSAPDGGQARAILDGFARSTGSVLAFVNSDDVLLPGALWEVARAFQESPRAAVVMGHNLLVDEADRLIGHGWMSPADRACMLCWGCTFAQPSCFWTRQAFDAVGGFDGELVFSFDFDLFLRLCTRYPVLGLDRHLSAVRHHAATKSSRLGAVCAEENARLRAQAGLGRIAPARRAAIALGWRAYRAAFVRAKRLGLATGLGASFDAAAIEAWFASLREPDAPLGATATGAHAAAPAPPGRPAAPSAAPGDRALPG